MNYTAGEASTDNLDVPEEVGGEEDEEQDGGDGGGGGIEVIGNPAYDHEVFVSDQDDHYEDDERERNAAAAREIAREMDTLGFPMPPPFTSLPQRQETPLDLPSPISTQVGPPQLAQPLETQQQSQEHQAPHPSFSQTNVPSHQQQQLTSRRTPSPLDPPSQAQSNVSPITAPSGHSYSPHRAGSPQGPPTTSISRNDYSVAVAASASNTSIPPPQTGVGGPRTISAAAFKRGVKDGEAKRRFLPASPSPRPSIDNGAVVAVSPAEGGAPSAHRPPALIPGGQPVTSSEPNEPSSPSSVLDYGALGHIRIANATQTQYE